MGAAGHTEAMKLLSADRLARIVSSEPICQEQIFSQPLRQASAGLVDQWGRVHRLSPRTTVGRNPGPGGIRILESSVSRRHAELYRDGEGRWYVVDLNSKNGTLVNDDTINEAVELNLGDAVFFGQVGFLFFLLTGEEMANASHLQQHPNETLRAEQGVRSPLAAEETTELTDVTKTDIEETTYVGLQHAPLSLLEPTGGGGGYLETNGKQVQLTATQFAFLQLLTERMRTEADTSESVRGFIRSSELLADLPWDTAHPEENHLKQLVRRVRRSLTRAGMGNLIESRRGFGYRLRIVPSP